MIGERQLINGDPWVVVDVAPAAALAEMVAALLEDEGFVSIVRGVEDSLGVLTHLGAHSLGATLVLVPEKDAERARKLIEETVTDYEGDELESVLASMELENDTAEDDDEAWPDDDEGPATG